MSTVITKDTEASVKIEMDPACPDGQRLVQSPPSTTELKPIEEPQFKKGLGKRPRVGNSEREILKTQFEDWKS